MFMGFTLHFYIIFGTNLFTGGPTQIVVFLPILVFRRKENRSGVPLPQASVATKNQSGPCSGTLSEGELIMEGSYIITKASPMSCE